MNFLLLRQLFVVFQILEGDEVVVEPYMLINCVKLTNNTAKMDRS